MDASIYRMRLQDLLALCVFSLLALGIVMVQSAAMNVTGDVRWSWTDRGTQHLFYVAVAIAAFFVVGYLDYGRIRSASALKNPAVWLLAIAFIACALVLVPGIGKEVNGARRWLPLEISRRRSGLVWWRFCSLRSWKSEKFRVR